MPLTSDFGISVSGLLTRTADLTVPSDSLSWNRGLHLDTGTGIGKADLRFHDTRTLAASATEDLDLAGVLTDVFGQAITFARVKLLIVAAAAGNANNVIVGGAATNTWVGPFGAATHTLAVRPGEAKVICATGDATAYPVTAGTGDLLKVANSGAGTSVTYDIIIVGASA
ncbi:hypothetical protein [Streptomyces sp. NBC_01268]|uniref:hypothetical protein n=1 Tax=Streptomyces sp. NBC_01268 TaxID=2903806 RepID=UPI002E32E186|nr:hypothetical protein [Streptomyces sp. NBC_01268]